MAATLLVVSIPAFSYDCYESAEYKESVAIAEASVHAGGRLLGVGVGILKETKGLGPDDALRAMLQYSDTPEAREFDRQLKLVADKIKGLKPRSPEECSALIKLQREYELIGRSKITFLIAKGTGVVLDDSVLGE